MKCDVCLTNIPLGEDTCPNCGYKIRVDHASSYNVSDKTHNHIQMKSNYVKKRVKNTLDKPTNQRGKYLSRIILIVLVIVIGLSFVSALFSTFSQIVDSHEMSFETDEYENLTYVEIIENDDDYDGTVEMALDDEEQIVGYLEDNNYQDVAVDETVSNSDFGLSASTFITATKGNYLYTLTRHYRASEYEGVNFAISGEFTTDRNVFILKENEIKGIADYIGVNSAYSLLKSSHGKMVKLDNENEYKYTYYKGDVNVYMSEKYEGNTDEPYYWFYYSLSTES